MAHKPPVILLAFANDKQGEYLRNLSVETRGIKEALAKAAETKLCEIIELTSATIEDIVDVFQDEDIGPRVVIFHYGGHAAKDALLLETRDGGHSIAHKEGLVEILSRQEALKLVFFNGCSSDGQTDAMLASGVPAVIGTATAINDKIATQLSIRFYKGLGQGSTIENAWQDSVAEAKIAGGGTANSRGVNWEGKVQAPVANEFAWALKFGAQQDFLKKWNLPETAGNPLFGLPALPASQLPSSPFVGLNNYEGRHAEVFFGRSKYIRKMYELVTDPAATPIIMLYGQAGVGKSSLIEAGLAPRLAGNSEVIIVRRDESLGWHISVFRELLHKCGFSTTAQRIVANDQQERAVLSLEEISKTTTPDIKPEIDRVIEKIKNRSLELKAEQDNSAAPGTLFEAWILAEKLFKKPLIVILDQLEEVISKPNPLLQDEPGSLLRELKNVFADPVNKAAGKIILVCKREYQARADERFREFEIAKNNVFLEKLDKEDITDIVDSLNNSPRLLPVYNLTIEDELLQQLIADHTLGNELSPISPFVQLLFTRMWELACERNADKKVFSIQLYRELDDDCIVMEDFLQRELEKIQKQFFDAHKYGLVLDLLLFHCTKSNTPAERTEAEILARYPYAKALVKQVIIACVDLLLLVKVPGGTNSTALAHEKIGEAVKSLTTSSNRAVQQAYRLLNDYREALQSGSAVSPLDAYKISTMEQAIPYLRALEPAEIKLIEDSKADLESRAKAKRSMAIARTALLFLLLAGGLVVGAFYWQLTKEERMTYMSKQAAASSSFLNIDNTRALVMAAEGYEAAEDGDALPAVKEAITAAFYTAVDSNRPFYRCIVKTPMAYLNCTYNPDKRWFIPFPQDSTGYVYDFNGNVVMKMDVPKSFRPRYGVSLLKYVQFTQSSHIIAIGSDSILRMWDIAGKLLYHSAGHKVTYFSMAKNSSRFALLYGDTVETRSEVGNFTRTMQIGNHCSSILMDPTASKIVAIYDDTSAQLLRMNRSGRCGLMQTLEYGRGPVKMAMFSNNGQYLLTAYWDASVVLWDSSGKMIHEYPKLDGMITGMDFHCSDSMFFIHTGYHGVLYSTLNFAALDSARHKDYVTFAKFSPLGDKIILGSSDKNGTIISLRGRPRKNLLGHSNDITSAFFTGGEDTVFTTSLDGTVRAWELGMYKASIVSGRQNCVTDLQTHPTKPLLCTIGSDSTLALWYTGDSATEAKCYKKKTWGVMHHPTFSPDGNRVMGITRNGVSTWEWKLNNTILFIGHKTPVIAAGYVGDNIVTIARDTLRIWDTSSGMPIGMMTAVDDTFCTLATSPGHDKMAVGTGKGNIYVFDSSIKKRDTLRGHARGYKIVSIEFSGDGRKLVSASEDNTAIIWNLEGKRPVQQAILRDAVQAHYYALKINKARFSKNGNYVVTASSDRAARVWLTNGKLYATLYGHHDDVLDAKFTPHDHVVTYSADGTVRYWQLEGAEMSVYSYKDQKIRQIAIDPAGEQIFAATEDGSIKTWFTPRGVYNWIKEQPFYRYFKENKKKYKVNEADKL